MRQILTEWLIPATIALFGLIFVADYSLGWPASRTWPLALILWGAFRVAAGLAEDASPQLSQPRRPSVFGPALLIVLGVLLLINSYYDQFSMTTILANNWPWALVAWGGSWMAEDVIARTSDIRRPRPLRAGALVVALLTCLFGMGVHGAFGEHSIWSFFDVI